ncbi:MAG: trypsin-like peptidase domain-containing protein, partial [Bdellovibrionales bacterium]|nr:trypsin-like peptidase domain-containing protein [Bdellovibrionales bacterium]
MKFLYTTLFLLSLSLLLHPQHSFAKLPKIEKGQPLPSDLFVELAKLVNPAVVNISTAELPKNQLNPNDPNRYLLEMFLGPQFQYSQQPRTSLGTGFIIRKDGLILTNNHVIDKADIIKVQLSEDDNTLYDATIIGKDARTDIALIKIDAKKDLPVANLGSSGDLEVGEWVAAFGNPFGHGHTMTKGIISAKGRSIDEINRFSFLQTDASINPGNSGGPLVNTKGEVVGVNSAIDPRAQGIGFAIPIDDVKSILPQLEKNGGIKRGYLGIYMDNITPRAQQALDLKVDHGALVLKIIPGSPAYKAKLKPYDVILEFNGHKTDDVQELMRAVSDSTVGQTIKVKIFRDGKETSLS